MILQTVSPGLSISSRILSYLIDFHIFTARKRSLAQDNIFTGVCLSMAVGESHVPSREISV